MGFDLMPIGSPQSVSLGPAPVVPPAARIDRSEPMDERCSSPREALAGEYFDLVKLRNAPKAVIYRAIDSLGEEVMLAEVYDRALCRRGPDGIVSARSEYEEAWANQLEETNAAISRLSCLAHPALRRLEQVLHANGTIYIASEPDDGETLDQALPNLSRSQIQRMSVGLIDLLAYGHAFGISGFAIRPEVLQYDGRSRVSVRLSAYVDGTMNLPKLNENTAGDDCRVLARTLKTLVANEPSNTWKARRQDPNSKYSPDFLSSLDSILDQRVDVAAREWAEAARGKTPRRKLTWHRLAAPVLVCAAVLGAVIWWGVPMEPLTRETKIERPVAGAGPWQVDLPLNVVEKDGNFSLKLTRPSPKFASLNPWARDGLKVTMVNGAPPTQPMDLRGLALATYGTASPARPSSLTISYTDSHIDQTVAVVPYVWREKDYGPVGIREEVTPDGWQLVVTTIQDAGSVPLRNGDVLVKEVVADQALSRLGDLEQAIESSQQDRHPSLTIQIQRASSRLVVGFAVELLSSP